MVYYTKVDLMEVDDLSQSKLFRKRNRIEVEGIVKWLVICNGFLKTKYFAFLADKENPVLPIYGDTDTSFIQARSEISMLKFSSETETPIKVRGILTVPNFIISYITGPNDQKKYLLKCEAVKLKNWESLLWHDT